MISFFDLIIVLINFTCFIIFQTLFTVIFTPKTIYKQVDYLIHFYKPWVKSIMKIYPELKINKKFELNPPNNKKLLLTRIGIPLIVLIGIIILCALIGILKKDKWSSHHTIGIFLVIFAYVTEILIFFLIFREYRFVNSSNIICDFIKKLKEQIKKEFPNKQNKNFVKLLLSSNKKRLDELIDNRNLIDDELLNKITNEINNNLNTNEIENQINNNLNTNEILNILN